MQIILATAVTAGFELLQPWCEQESVHTVLQYREILSAPLAPRLRAKRAKMLMHEQWPSADLFVWLDGSMEITSPQFVDWLVAQLGDQDVAFFKHPDRNCAYAEAKYCIQEIAAGNQYLRRRYDPSELEQQMWSYKVAWAFPRDAGLYCGGLFIRRNTAAVNQLFDRWWIEQELGSMQDQLSLPFVLWQNPEVKVATLPGSIWGNEYFKWRGHMQANGSIEAFK